MALMLAGFRDDLYKANPIVTLNHSYYESPIGRSLWRKKVKDGDRRGVKAKTRLPAAFARMDRARLGRTLPGPS
jgi:hypothetical protein